MVVRLALHFGAGTFVYVQTQPLQTVGIGNIVEHNLECVFNADVVDQLYRLYNAVMEKGAENYKDIISETFLETKYLNSRYR